MDREDRHILESWTLIEKFWDFEGAMPWFEKDYQLYQKQISVHELYSLVPEPFIEGLRDRCQMDKELVERIKAGVLYIEQNACLYEATRFLIWELCVGKQRLSNNHYGSITPRVAKEIADIYPFILLLSCVEPSMHRLASKHVPIEIYKDIPYIAIQRQVKQWEKDGNVTVDDFQWEINFYTCTIFLFDRFYFAHHQLGEDLHVFREKGGSHVRAFYGSGKWIDNKGRIHSRCEDSSWLESIWKEDGKECIGYPIRPYGRVSTHIESIEKDGWEEVLKGGSTMLALHVPDGPGYEPKRLKNSISLAVDFYLTYFPELDIQGIWSESWLYDPVLETLDVLENSRILAVQQQYYCYPIESNDHMIFREVFGKYPIDVNNYPCSTRLQQAVVDAIEEGKTFQTTSMFILIDDIEAIGSRPYR